MHALLFSILSSIFYLLSSIFSVPSAIFPSILYLVYFDFIPRFVKKLLYMSKDLLVELDKGACRCAMVVVWREPPPARVLQGAFPKC